MGQKKNSSKKKKKNKSTPPVNIELRTSARIRERTIKGIYYDQIKNLDDDEEIPTSPENTLKGSTTDQTEDSVDIDVETVSDHTDENNNELITHEVEETPCIGCE